MAKQKRKEDPSPLSEGSGSVLSDDPSVAQTVEEDALLTFLTSYWRQIFFAVAVVAAGFYANSRFNETYVASMRQGADQFDKVTAEYRSYVDLKSQLKTKRVELAGIGASEETAAQKETLEKEILGIEERVGKSVENVNVYLSALETEREPYSRLAKFYAGLLAYREGDTEALKRSFEQGGLLSAWKDPNAEENLKFYSEVASLAYARGLLDGESSYAEGRVLLEQLAENGRLVGASALLTLSRISVSPEERERVVVMLEEFLQKHPEQRDVLENELERLS